MSLNPHLEDVQQRRRPFGDSVETYKSLPPRKKGRIVMSTKGGLANRNGSDRPWVPRVDRLAVLGALLWLCLALVGALVAALVDVVPKTPP